MTMIERPQDIAIIFGIAALVVTTMGIGFIDVQERMTSPENTTFFTNMEEYATSSDYYKGATDDSTSAMSNNQDTGGTSDSFIVQMGLALFKLGKIWSAMKGALNSAIAELNIPPSIIAIVLGMVIISLAVTIYAYWRGMRVY